MWLVLFYSWLIFFVTLANTSFLLLVCCFDTAVFFGFYDLVVFVVFYILVLDRFVVYSIIFFNGEI